MLKRTVMHKENLNVQVKILKSDFANCIYKDKNTNKEYLLAGTLVKAKNGEDLRETGAFVIPTGTGTQAEGILINDVEFKHYNDNEQATVSIEGEGSDFPQLECLINATGGKGGGDASDSGETGRVTIQILGRGMRKHPKKKTFDYVDFLDNSHRFLKNASRDRISTLRSEGYTEFIDFWENR